MTKPAHTNTTHDVPAPPITFVSTLPLNEAPADPALPHIPGYEIVCALERGGMGIVYQARQVAADRIVALKMILGSNAAPEQLARFRDEARAVAQLQHPGIVQIYEVGDVNGVPYFSLEFCAGGSLKDRLREQPLSPAEAATLLVAVAQATQAAHDAGIIHRDLTPGNILFDNQERPRIADFGLAKKLDDVGRTQSGAIMGTPYYMAPEQAVGHSKQVGPAADVWALGAILYECLTGRPPFKADTSLETLLLVITQEPLAPRRLKPDLPRDLEIICLKCLQKEPGKRYASAAHLADDLGRFQRGEPIQAREVTWLERLGLWARRQPAQAAASVLAVLAVLLATFGVTSSWLLHSAHAARSEAEGAKGLAEESLRHEKVAQERLNRVSSLHQVELAYHDWQSNSLMRSRELLQRCPETYRDWEWFHVHHLCHGYRHDLGEHRGAMRAVAYRPDGKQIATAGDDGHIQLWQADTGELDRTLSGSRQAMTCLTYSRDGQRLVAGCADGTVWVWQVKPGGRGFPILAHEHPITSVALSADDAWIASTAGGDRGEGNIKLHDARTGTLLRSLLGLSRLGIPYTHSVAFSQSGKLLAADVGDHVIKVWDFELNQGQEVASLTGHADVVTALAFSRDDQWLASASQDRTVRYWDVPRQEPVRTYRGHTAAVTCVAFRPDNRTLVSGSADRLIHVWDRETGAKVDTIRGHEHPINAVAPSPDGREVASVAGAAGQPGEARVWTFGSGRASVAVKASSSAIRCLTFTPNGAVLFSGDDKRTVTAWATATGDEVAIPPRYSSRVNVLTTSKDGRWVATASDQTVRLWDAHSSVLVATLEGHTRAVTAVAISPGGQRLASADAHGEVRVWDREKAKELHCLKGHKKALRAIAFVDDKRLVSGGEDGVVILWDGETGQQLGTARGHQRTVTCLCAGPGPDQFVSGSEDTTVRVWDCQTCRERHLLQRRETQAQNEPEGASPIRAVVCPADSGQIISVTDDAAAQVWKADGTWIRRQTLGASLVDVTISPDGRFAVAMGAWDGPGLFRTDTGALVRSFLRLRGVDSAMGISPDGKVVWCGSHEGRLAGFDTATGQQVRVPLSHSAAVVRIDLDGTARFITTSADGRKRTWDATTAQLLKDEAGDVPKPMAIDHQGRTIVLRPGDRTVSVCETGSGHELVRLSGHIAEVKCATFSPDGRRVVTGAADGTVKVWDPVSGEDALTLSEFDSPITSVAFSPDGTRLAAATATGEIRIWSAPRYMPRK